MSSGTNSSRTGAPRAFQLGRVCKTLMRERSWHDTRRFDRRSMGTLGATPAPKEAPEGSSECRSSAYHKRHPLDRSHRITLARPPREVWSVEDGCQPLLPLWQKAGVWDHILKALQSHKDADGGLDWEVHYLDATIVRAHQHAAGAKGGTKRSKL